ncbi:MAG: hypothetical protein [Microvirus sp.]|nr:MAG: hypothetical protein [Microvirus sp.]
MKNKLKAHLDKRRRGNPFQWLILFQEHPELKNHIIKMYHYKLHLN